jgi:hypothetical protein
MTSIPSANSSYYAYARRATGGQLASAAAAALAASATQGPTEISRRDLYATLGKSLDAAA